MKKSFLVVTSFLLLSVMSCQDISGVLDVKQKLSLNTRNGQSQLLIGQYKSEVELSKKKMTLKVYRGEEELKYRFELPDGYQFPQGDGDIFLSSVQVNQPYDISGDVTSQVSIGQTQVGHETCTRYVPYTYCDYGRRYGQSRCYTRYQTYIGQRRVEYRLQTIEKQFEIDLLAPQSNLVVASFDAVTRNTNRLYDYTGYCQ